jgi:hypothetical protein
MLDPTLRERRMRSRSSLMYVLHEKNTNRTTTDRVEKNERVLARARLARSFRF